jgi:nicotinate-nucleotide adenylyltransferase
VTLSTGAQADHTHLGVFWGTCRVTQIFGSIYTEFVPLRLGLLGGTFDPPHVAHVVVAVHARQQLALDEVVLMVANDPWQKTDSRAVTAAHLRLEMVQAAVDGVEGVRAGDDEIRRGGPTYTIDTVKQLQTDHPGAEIFVIIGEDAARGFHTWHHHEELAQLSNLVIVNRGDVAANTTIPDGMRRVERVTIPLMNISSSDIRTRVATGAPIDSLVRSSVEDIIRREHLYVVDQ